MPQGSVPPYGEPGSPGKSGKLLALSTLQRSMINAAECSGAVAFKPSLFQAFFRAEREVFRLFQRRGALPRWCEFRAARGAGNHLLSWRWIVKPASAISHAGSRVRCQPPASQPHSPTRRPCSVLGERSFAAAMLYEHQPPAGLQDAAELSQRAVRVRDRAKRVGEDHGIGHSISQALLVCILPPLIV